MEISNVLRGAPLPFTTNESFGGIFLRGVNCLLITANRFENPDFDSLKNSNRFSLMLKYFTGTSDLRMAKAKILSVDISP